jgi:hypothetical protein
MKKRRSLPWSVQVSIQDVPETGRQIELAADEAARSAIAELAGLRALPRLVASFELRRHSREGLHVVGRISATVGQICVVTLEPMETEVEESVDLIFTPAPQTAGDTEGTRQVPEEGPETMVDGRIDLGHVATEFLILGIDPYPRKAGVSFQAPPMAEDGGHPFAALAALKKAKADE